MNAFYEHHKDSIRFGYRCFDRILLNGLIQPFQQPERVVGFFSTYRHLHPVSRDILRGAAEQFQLWVKEQADKWNAPIVEPPRGRRDEFVDPYFRGARPDQVIVILKAREPARIMTAIGDKKVNRWHLQIVDRWIGDGGVNQHRICRPPQKTQTPGSVPSCGTCSSSFCDKAKTFFGVALLITAMEEQSVGAPVRFVSKKSRRVSVHKIPR